MAAQELRFLPRQQRQAEMDHQTDLQRRDRWLEWMRTKGKMSGSVMVGDEVTLHDVYRWLKELADAE